MMAPSTRPLLHPLSLAGLAVLVVNDQILKTRWENVVTGKLSDLAGMIFFPAFLFAIVAPLTRAMRRDDRAVFLACTIATAVVFALVKTVPEITQTYRVALGAMQWPWQVARALVSGSAVPGVRAVAAVTDPTDLLALPLLLVPALVIAPGAKVVTRDRANDARCEA
jgi:hypothetical protein